MKAAISAVAALALALPPTAALANLDGALDTTLHPSLGGFPYFGVPGLLDYAIDYGGAAPDTNNDYASAVLPLPDGRFYVAGQSWSAGNPLSSHVGVLERFLADGSVDATFGTNGRVLFGGGGMTDCYITSIALQGNKPLIAQSYRLTGSPSVEYTRLTRLDTDGTLDRILIGPDEAPIPNEGLAKVITDAAGDMYVAAHFNHAQGTRFEVIFASGDAGPGNESSFNFALGSGAQDGARATDLVLRHMPLTSCGDGCIIAQHDELFAIGSAFMGSYGDGLPNHDCVVVAFRRRVTDLFFGIDPGFNGGNPLLIDFPVGTANEGDNICRAAAPRDGSGIVIGGENFFISTLGGGSPGVASNYALAEVDGAGNVTRRDVFAFFEQLATPGIYNGIYGMAREAGGKLVVTGFAGTTDANRAPSDAAVVRFNADYSRDASFGNDGAGLAIVSLDGQGSMATAQREWASSLALDNHGRILLVGTRSYNLASNNDYDWLVGRLANAGDVIFRDGFDNRVP